MKKLFKIEEDEPPVAQLNIDKFAGTHVYKTDTDSSKESEYLVKEPDLPDPGVDQKFVIVVTTQDSIIMVTNY